jgi:hypothetical protein
MQKSVQSDCGTEKIIEERIGIVRILVASLIEGMDETVVKQHQCEI